MRLIAAASVHWCRISRRDIGLSPADNLGHSHLSRWISSSSAVVPRCHSRPFDRRSVLPAKLLAVPQHDFSIARAYAVHVLFRPNDNKRPLVRRSTLVASELPPEPTKAFGPQCD